MATITDIEKVRFDQRIIEESMSPQDVWNLSGKAVRVRTVRWKCEGREVFYTSTFGLTTFVTPDRTYLAVVEASNEAWSKSRLLILNADGTVRFAFDDRLEMQSGPKSLNFVGVTGTVNASASIVTVVAVPLGEDAFSITQRMDLDAQTGVVLAVREAR